MHPLLAGAGPATPIHILAKESAEAVLGALPEVQRAFTAANGDVFRWKRLWSVIADFFGLEPAPYPER